MIASLLRLREFLLPYKGTLALGIGAFLVARIFEALVPFFLARGIDTLAAGGRDVLVPVLGIVLSVAARFGTVSFARFTVRKVGQFVAFDLRQRLYQQLQLQGARFFNRYTIGDMMTRAISDIGLVQRLIAMGTILLVVFAFATIVGFSFMLFMSPELTLLILPPLPFVFVYTYQASKQMGIASRDVQDRLSDLGSHVQENLSGIRTIQAMVQEENETRRFAATNQSYADAFYEQARINSAMAAWMPTLTAVSSLVILGWGGHMVLEGEISVGTFTAFFMYLGMVVQPFRVAGFIVNLFQRAAVASDRLFEVFDLAPEIDDRPSGAAPATVRGAIDVRNLRVRYEGAGVDALAGIDLSIAPGETVAIMGRVGAGKSTLLRTLVRLIDTPRGMVRIDGHDIQDYPLSQLRSQLAMVPQDPFLFGEPLRDNLTYDDPERTVDAILRAAESADFRATVEQFPERLDTVVGERGVTLSGGQKQRATLARGLIRNAPVLILDDCFSAVDTETEEHILSELKHLREGQTTILVSHRVSTARHADRIVVLEDGRIVEEGTHPELVARRVLRGARADPARGRNGSRLHRRSDRMNAQAGGIGATPPRRDHSMFDAELSGQVLNMRLLRRLLRWLRPYRATVALSAVLILVSSGLQILLPVIISLVVVDHLLLEQPDHPTPDMGMIASTEWLAHALTVHPLFAACLLYAVLHVGWALTGHWHRLTLTRAVINGLRDLRLDLFRHLETRPSSFYDRVAVGRIMTRVTNDVEALYELLRGMGTLIGEFVPFFVALGIMLAVDAQLTALLLLGLPVMGAVTTYFRRATQRLFRLVRLSVSALNQNLQENLAGLQVVQLSDRQERNLARYTTINVENRNLEIGSMRLETLYGAFTDSIASIALGVIVWYAGGAMVQDAISLGGVILFTRFIDMLFHPIVVLGEQMNILFRAMASGERIFQALDWDEKIHEPAEPAALPARLRGEVEFRHLEFGYDPQVPVIRDVSFTIAPGEKLAIVGPTGSGKSTLIRLLGRFYDFPDGRIFLDGIDLNRIHTRDLRRRVGVVLQDFHIFSGTIYDNIALGDPSIGRERAIAAAKTVNAHDFISRLPNGYDSQLSERGQNLSQGQRQLLAFARVLAADPEILVLDEATASIDTETELLIQDALRKLTAGRTSILIAHRLQTIQEADRVLVLHHGRVEELGTHEELLAKKGLYYTLHTLQFQAVSEDEADEVQGRLRP